MDVIEGFFFLESTNHVQKLKIWLSPILNRMLHRLDWTWPPRILQSKLDLKSTKPWIEFIQSLLIGSFVTAIQHGTAFYFKNILFGHSTLLQWRTTVNRVHWYPSHCLLIWCLLIWCSLKMNTICKRFTNSKKKKNSNVQKCVFFVVVWFNNERWKSESRLENCALILTWHKNNKRWNAPN